MADEPTDDQLKLVVRHGNGSIERALATVQLAKRRGREDDLRRLIEAVGSDGTERERQ